MLRKFFRLFSSMADRIDIVQFNSEQIVSSYREKSVISEKRQLIENYLVQHDGDDYHAYVHDFPTGHEWINTLKPLSIYNDFKGKLVMLDFFTYCCINCMHILPDLKALEKKFSIEDGLVVIGVHYAKFINEKQTANILSAVKRYGITHPVVNDAKGIIWDSLHINCWPSVVLIDSEARVLLVLRGEGHFEFLKDFIEITLSSMKKKDCFSNHLLPQIRVTDELTGFSPLSFPGKISYSEEEKIFAISDSGHHRILILQENGIIKFIIGGLHSGFKDGNFAECKFNSPQGLVFKNSNIIYVADTENHAIRQINLKKQYVNTLAGTGKQGNDRKGGKIWNAQELSSPWDLCFCKVDHILLIAMAGHHQIWALYLNDDESNLFKKGKQGECKSIAGSGREENRNNLYPHMAAFAQPSGLTYCPDRDSVFIADSESSSVRELNLTSGKVSYVVGGSKNPLDLFAFGDVDGVNYKVKLQHPLGVLWNNNNKKLYVADSYNHKIKVIELSQENKCTTMEMNTMMNEPAGLCMYQNNIVVADTNHNLIKVIDLSNSQVSLLPVTVKESKKPEIINEEKNIEINSEGGQISILLNIDKTDSISFTEDAPSSWSITFTDEDWQTLAINEINADFQPRSVINVDLPKSQNVKILIKGLIYYCDGSFCSMKKLFFVINSKYSDSASKNASCDFKYFISN